MSTPSNIMRFKPSAGEHIKKALRDARSLLRLKSRFRFAVMEFNGERLTIHRRTCLWRKYREWEHRNAADRRRYRKSAEGRRAEKYRWQRLQAWWNVSVAEALKIMARARREGV